MYSGLSYLEFHLFSVLEHVRNKHVGSHKVGEADIAFDRPLRIVRFQMASEMSRPRVRLLAVLDDASVVGWRRNLVCSSVAAFQTGALRSGSTAVFQAGLFNLESFWWFVWKRCGGEVRVH